MIKKISNMTIATRLTIAFVPIITIFALAILHANYTTSYINNLHRHNIDYVVARADYTLYIQYEFMAFRRLTRASVMNIEWREVVTEELRLEYEREITEYYYRINELAYRYMQLVLEDDGVLSGYYEYESCVHMTLITESLAMVNKVYQSIVDRFFLSGSQSYEEGNLVAYSDEVYDMLMELRGIALHEREYTLAMINAAVATSTEMSTLMSILFLVVAVCTVIMLVKSYKRNIQDLEGHIALVEKGDFETHRESLGNNEISSMFVKLTNVFTGLIGEINNVSDEIKNKNDILRINADDFQGSYNKAALAVNALIDTLVESKEREINASRRLGEASARAKIVFDRAPFAISFWTVGDDDIKITDLNDSFMDMFGVDDKEMLLREFPQSFTPELQPCGTPSREYTLKYTQKAVEEGSYKFDLMHFDINKKPIPCEVVSVSAKFRDTHVIIAYARDMRDIVESQEQVREANERVQLMLDSTPLACFLIDRRFNAIDCNAEAVSLFELNEKDDCIRCFERISRCNMCLRTNRKCEQAGIACKLKAQFGLALLEGHSKIEWSLQIPGTDKSIPCEINYVRLVHKGEFVVAAYITDLRIRNKLIEDTRKLEMAEENSMAKSQFLASISHEIRTPMNAILGITEIQLQKPTIDQELKEAFEKIYISGDMLLGIINDILDLSKIEAGKMEITVEKYEVASLFHDTAVLNIMRTESKQIKFEMSVSETVPAYMLGDELRIKQIINNVLSNAFKYTDEGLVKMTVNAEHDNDGSDKVVLIITVSDTGQGMSKEQTDRLFEAYARFNTKANHLVQGTGLGMSITKNLINLMEGDISVESELGKGSTFTISLPQTKVGDEMVGKEALDSLDKLQEGRSMKMKRVQIMQEPMPYGKVLIVDDVDMNIYVAKGLMLPYELQVDSADSGLAAIEKIEQGNEYDIVFMDYMMPGLDGIETTKRLRDMGYKLPIVALTANAIVGQSEKFLKNGFDEFISKPIDIRQLNSVLNKLIRDKRPEGMRTHKVQISANQELGEYLKTTGIYDMVYRDFGRSQKNFTPELTEAIESNDLKKAHLMAHTLKGLAGLIGEPQLVNLAREAEEGFRDGIVPAACVEELHEELERVLAMIIDKYGVIEAVVQREDVTLDKEEAKAVFDELEPLLEGGRFDALNLCDRLMEIPSTAKLIEQIENFDFRPALATIAELRKSLEV